MVPSARPPTMGGQPEGAICAAVQAFEVKEVDYPSLCSKCGNRFRDRTFGRLELRREVVIRR